MTHPACMVPVSTRIVVGAKGDGRDPLALVSAAWKVASTGEHVWLPTPAIAAPPGITLVGLDLFAIHLSPTIAVPAIWEPRSVWEILYVKKRWFLELISKISGITDLLG